MHITIRPSGRQKELSARRAYFISRQQRAKGTCLSVHLAAAAGGLIPDACMAASLMPCMLVPGFLHCPTFGGGYAGEYVV